MRYVVFRIEEKKEMDVHIWSENISHVEYIALVAGIDGDITIKSKAEKEPFLNLLQCVSSMGMIKASPSRGWYLEGAEADSRYKDFLEQDCSCVLKYMDKEYGFPVGSVEIKNKFIQQKDEKRTDEKFKSVDELPNITEEETPKTVKVMYTFQNKKQALTYTQDSPVKNASQEVLNKFLYIWQVMRDIDSNSEQLYLFSVLNAKSLPRNKSQQNKTVKILPYTEAAIVQYFSGQERSA